MSQPKIWNSRARRQCDMETTGAMRRAAKAEKALKARLLLREEPDLSMTAIALRLGVCPDFVSKVRKGMRR